MNSKERFEKIKCQYNKSNKYALYLSYDDIGFLLNIIEKTTKELEQEKEKNKELEAKRIWNKVRIEKQQKEIEQEKEKYKRLQNTEAFSECYISKDKIKEKIEETSNEKLNYSEDEYYLENEIKGYAIDKLKDLLEV